MTFRRYVSFPSEVEVVDNTETLRALAGWGGGGRDSEEVGIPGCLFAICFPFRFGFSKVPASSRSGN